MNNGERIGREQDSDGNRLSSKMTSMESCDRQDIDGNGFRTPFRYLRDKFGKKDVENTSPACHSSTYPELLDILKKEFDDMVEKKMNVNKLGRQDAEMDVFVDVILKEQNSDCDNNAVLFILSKIENDEEEAHRLVTYSLLHRSANPSAKDEQNRTPLHLAVKNNFKNVCTKLLDHNAEIDEKDKENETPYTLALQNRNDDIAAILIRKMKNESVRALFSCGDNPKISFHDLLEKEDMSETVLAVLDCLKEPIGEVGKVRVYYNLLEADRYGNVPSDRKKFDSESRTGFQIIAQRGDKKIVNHDVVRLLIMRKWEKYARCRFLFKSLLNLITLMTITFSAIVSSTAQDPTVYDISALQIARAVCEMWSLGMTIHKLIDEIQQFYKLRLQYFKYASNWIDTTSCFLILLLPPLRYTHKNEQWFVFSAAYLFWTARMFQYATVFRKSGAYVLVLRRIIKHDILQFTIFFVFILLSFSGCLLLSLRGEGSLEKFSESSTFWSILFVGIRILVESERILEYTEFQMMSVIIMVGFLFTICIVLLNMLIGQVSDTFQKFQQDEQREYEVNRASIVMRMEQTSLCFCKKRNHIHFVEGEVIDGVGKIFKKSDYPPTENLVQCYHDISERLNLFEKDFCTISPKLCRLETMLQEALDKKARESSYL